MDQQDRSVLITSGDILTFNFRYSFCAFFSLTMVLISTFTFIISTIDELQENDDGKVDLPFLLKIINVVDVITISFFTLEYFIRLACAPRKLKFVRGPMNMIDLFAIIPFYLSLLLEGLEDFEIIGKTGKIIRLIKGKRIVAMTLTCLLGWQS